MDNAGQLQSFIAMLLTGAALGLVFDVYRVLRGRARYNHIVTSLGDLLYWVLATLLTACVLFFTNGGEVRVYVLLALISGAVLYFRLISRMMVKFIVAWLNALSVALRWLYKIFYCCFFYPLCQLLRGISWPFRAAFQKIGSYFEKNDNFNQKPPD